MKALLIHADGRADVLFGESGGDLTKAAVLTQAVLSALESDGPCQAVQCRQDGGWTTLLPVGAGRWLRLSHEPGVTVEQAQEWAAQLPLPPERQSGEPSLPQSDVPVFPDFGRFTTLPAAVLEAAEMPPRVTTLADALNVEMP